MLLKDFLFSYKNILLECLRKKKFFTFLRRLVNLPYKFLANLFKKKFFKSYTNLDTKNNVGLLEKNIDHLFLNFNCDKGSSVILDGKKVKSHNYSIFYEKYLRKLKSKDINILELGSHEGNGIASFFYYFPKSKLFGANINPFQLKYFSKRIREIFVDVSSKKNMKNLAEYFDEYFDVIIDDASHNLADILFALPIFFKKLKKGGYYVIEDIDQFKVFKNLNPKNEKLTPIMILKNLEKNQKFDSNYISNDEIEYLKKNIKDYYFEKGEMILNDHNISDIVFLKKNV